MLNILHFHINDMSDEVSIDQRWLTQEERDLIVNGRMDQVPFKEFKRDVNGMLLRYLILIHDQKVLDILYNAGDNADPQPIRYREYKVDMDKYQTIKFQKGAPQFQFGKITFIPYQMVSTENKQHCEQIVEGTIKNQMTMHCQERSFVRLPGYVDVDVYSANSLESIRETPLKIAVPICKIKPAEEHHVMQYEAILASQDESIYQNIQQLLDTLSALLLCPPANDATVEDLNEYLITLGSNEGEIDQQLETNRKVLDKDPERRATIEA